MILVTGGTGHLGAHLLYQLVSENKPVRAIVRNHSRIEITRRIFSLYSNDPDTLIHRIEWVEGDVTDYGSILDALKDVSVVYHAAGFVSFSERQKKKLENVNSTGTANIVNSCLEAGVKRLCHVSTIATLGETSNNETLTETLIWNQGESATAYAKSKFRGEMEVWRGIHEGLNAVIVNPSVIIGPGMWLGKGNDILKSVYRGLKFYTTGSTGFVDVRDVAKIMVLLTEGTWQGERYILNSENLSYKTILDYIATAMDKPKPFVMISPGLAKLALYVEKVRAFLTGTTPRMSSKSLEIAFENLNYSNRKILEIPEVKFLSVQESISDTIKAYLIRKS